jgi:hypothetical protein
VWIDVALGEVEEAKKIIASVPKSTLLTSNTSKSKKLIGKASSQCYLTMPKLGASFYDFIFDFIFGVAPGNPLLTTK